MGRTAEIVVTIAVGLGVAFGSEACFAHIRDRQYASGENTRPIPSFSTDNPFIREARDRQTLLDFPQVSEADLRRSIIWEERNQN